jgi:hypothetical protein
MSAETISNVLGMLMIAGFAIFALVMVLDSFGAFELRPKFLTKKVEPRIGYKRAFLTPQSHGDQHFRGVVGHTYGVESDASNRYWGFHAYESFAKAYKHPQQGNVFLEVVLSGHVKEHEDGYIASHQRVLQVIPDTCYRCSRQTTHFALTTDPDPTSQMLFVCAIHKPLTSVSVRAMNFFKKFDNEILTATNVRPIAELNKELPWLDQHGIVVAELAGPNKLVPTVIS